MDIMETPKIVEKKPAFLNMVNTGKGRGEGVVI